MSVVALTKGVVVLTIPLINWKILCRCGANLEITIVRSSVGVVMGSTTMSGENWYLV